MRILLVAALVLSAPLAFAEDSVTLTVKAPRVGAKLVREMVTSSEMEVTSPNGKQVSLSTSQTQKTKIEVLAVKSNAMTKARFAYEVDSKVEKTDDKQVGGPTVLQGKTFTVTAGTPTKVEGKNATEEEIDLVRRHEKRFGEPDRIEVALAGKKFVKGAEVDLLDADVDNMFGSDGKGELTAFSATYTGMVGNLAAFTIKARLEIKQFGWTTDITGNVTLDSKTARIVDLDVAGRMKGSGKVAVIGTIRMKAKQR